ncbi:rmlC-like jelly roll fold protein [Artemisia annua]|uniref:RmlC-like jelly roll fold protein n=1 Tax=Artemisia annua TaxID=35608 RepID=A0A2U1LFX8_ARTAN|nr:rmlC-like jelly roll fold protein [Artemisia annua]
MAKVSPKWLFILLALVVVVVGVSGQIGPPGGRQFPPGPGSRGGQQFPPGSRGSGGQQFPPGSRGGGGRDFPPEEPYGGGGGRDFPPEEPSRGGGGGRGWTDMRKFILSDTKRMVATDAGGMRVVKGVGGRYRDSPMHIGFITMEPNSMFIPQYLDSSLIIFVELGEARIGSIYNDAFVEQDLKSGDLYRIQAGSAFYLVNTAQGQRLHIITSIDTAESIDSQPFEAFYLGGGANPPSVLKGFDKQTLATALNVSYDALGELLSNRKEGAIVFLNPDGSEPEREREPSMWKSFLEQGTHERKSQMKKIVNVRQKAEKEVEKSTWSLRSMLISLLGENKKTSTSLDAYNIYDRKADFRNDYGWSVAVNGDDYEPLKLSDFGAYLVNLTAGSMMAPHINPTATEYGVVLSGTGRIQIVYPNGTLAMDAEVNEGDVFWIPRYFPFCQVASRTSPFVFFGFATSARNNRPQFLAGRDSLLQTMLGPEFAAAFGMPEDKMADILNAQTETTILPSAAVSPGGGDEEIPEGGGDRQAGGDDRQAGGDDQPQGEAELLMKKMNSKIRMKKSSFAYNMAMGMD